MKLFRRKPEIKRQARTGVLKVKQENSQLKLRLIWVDYTCST
jgi:hypothetical protein